MVAGTVLSWTSPSVKPSWLPRRQVRSRRPSAIVAAAGSSSSLTS